MALLEVVGHSGWTLGFQNSGAILSMLSLSPAHESSCKLSAVLVTMALFNHKGLYLKS